MIRLPCSAKSLALPRSHSEISNAIKKALPFVKPGAEPRTRALQGRAL